MARSAFIQLIRRAFAINQLSRFHHVTPQDAEEFLNRALSRRQVLQAGALATGMVTMGSLPIPPVSDPQIGDRVLIVGAGIAGLTAAYRLRQAGVPIDIVEASHRVGGRILSFTDLPGLPGTVELGGEFIDTRHRAVLALASELGLELGDLHQADTGLDPEVLYFKGQKVSHGAIVEAFSPLAERIARDLKPLTRYGLHYRNPSPAAARLDRLSLAEYLDSTPIDPIIEQLIRVAYVTEFGRDAHEQSCLNMLFLIGAEVGKWSTYGISDERWHVIGGNSLIPFKLAEQVSDAIQAGTELESIRSSADGRYRVSLRQDGTSSERSYERILLAIPFSVLRYVDLAVTMPPAKRRAIQQLGYGTGTKLATPYQERLWRTRYQSTVSIYSDLEFQNTWESARYATGPHGWLTNLRGGQQGIVLGSGSPDTHAEQLTTHLDAIFPGMSRVERGRAIRMIWPLEPYAGGSYSCYKPGQWTQFAGIEGERVGNLWFAGEHCAAESQGYMNGACETAELAVISILDDLGLQAHATQLRNRMMTVKAPVISS